MKYFAKARFSVNQLFVICLATRAITDGEWIIASCILVPGVIYCAAMESWLKTDLEAVVNEYDHYVSDIDELIGERERE